MPPSVSDRSAVEAIELASSAGLVLDPWECFALEMALGEKEGGLWSAFEVLLLVARQNGKGSVLEARQLAGLFLFGEELMIYSAHRFDTSLVAFRRLLRLVEGTPDLSRRVRRVAKSHGEEGIELLSGQQIGFRTRISGGGRGFSADCLFLDEAMYLPAEVTDALMPTMSARRNPQVWYVGSAVNSRQHQHGETLTRVRNRGLVGGDPSLCALEWSPDVSIEDVEDGSVDLDDPRLVTMGNPGLGYRITPQHVANERRSMTRRSFAIERCNIGDWPVVSEEGGWSVVKEPQWVGSLDPGSVPGDVVAFGLSMPEDRSRCVISVAGVRSDGLFHGEVVDARPGSLWVIPRMVVLVARWDPVGVVIDASDAAAGLAEGLIDNGIDSTLLAARAVAAACGGWFDAITQDRYRHRGDGGVGGALRHARKRRLGGAWVWDRESPGEMAPLIAGTCAWFGVATHRERGAPPAPRPAGNGGGQKTGAASTADLAGAAF